MRKAAELSLERLETIGSITSTLSQARKAVRGVTKERKNRGDKLVQLGTVLFLIPDPFTTAASLPVLAAGAALRKRSVMSLRDVAKSSRSCISELASLRSEISGLRCSLSVR